MYHNVKKIFLTLFLVGSISHLQGATPLCPVSNQVVLSCENVRMEALWVRLGHDMNSVAALNLATTDFSLIEAFNTDAQQTYANIASKIQVFSIGLHVAFDKWYNAYVEFYQNPQGGTGSAYNYNYLTATNNLASELKTVYTQFLPSSEIDEFYSVVSTYLNALYTDSTNTVLYFNTPSQFSNGGESSGFVLTPLFLESILINPGTAQSLDILYLS